MQPETVTRVPYSVENARVLYEALRAAGIDFVTYLPDSGTFPVQQLMAADPAVTSVLCAREDEGFAIAMGAAFAGKRLLMLMEGSGYGMSGLILARGLVQHTPLAIRFRFDEKRFDIDGAYNMRYEIVKKRIDKARIRGTHERLTQPGTIVMVYSQVQEAIEYQEYIEYVQAAGYLTPGIEHLELEDLEGAQGLRALRVTVDMQEAREQQGALDDMTETVRLLVH